METIEYKGLVYHVVDQVLGIDRREEVEELTLSVQDNDDLYGAIGYPEYIRLLAQFEEHDNTVLRCREFETDYVFLIRVREHGKLLIPKHNDQRAKLTILNFPLALDITDAYATYRKLQLLIDGDD